MQATAEFLVNQTKQLRDDALNWAQRTDADLAAKEHDIETLKQEYQTHTSRLKVSYYELTNCGALYKAGVPQHSMKQVVQAQQPLAGMV